MDKKKAKQIGIGTTILAPILFCLTPLAVGLLLTHPKGKKTEESPEDYGLDFEEIMFTSCLGDIVLRGWWIPAANPSSKTVITAHGYTDELSQKSINALRLVKTLHENNLNVLMFDFRNSGKSDGHRTGIGFYEQHDLFSAVDFAKNVKKQEQIVLLGWSMGAATSLLVGTKHPDVIGVIADSPFHDLSDYLKENLSVWSKLPKKPFTKMIMTLMEQLLKIDPKEVSPIKVVEEGHSTNYLIIHGKNDSKIPYQSSEQIFEQIPPSTHKKIWLTEHDHITSYVEEKEMYEKTILAFLNRTFK